MNNAVISGTIASEPVLQYTQDGQTAIAVTTLQIPGLRGDDPAETLKAVVWGNTGQEFGVRKFPVGTEMVFEGRLSMDLVERDGYKEKVAKLNVNRFYPITSVPASTPPSPIAPPPTPPATAEPAKATAKASKGKAEAAKAPVAEKTEEYEANYEDIPF